MPAINLIIAALLLDALMGEPKWLWSRIPHPVRLMGGMINKIDILLNKNTHKRLKGVLALFAMLVLVAGLGWGLTALPGGDIIQVGVAAILLGQRSLVQHVSAVGKALRQDLGMARGAVAMIVGRETKNLSESGVARAAIESAAENFSDGVVAPVFWFVLFGLPGMLAYKLVNTADSMIGYRNEKYLEFGWAAARLDDVMNYIPARISAGLLVLGGLAPKALAVIRKDAGQHRSPNAGWPEAAMAGALDLALSGPRVYDGQRTDDSFVNETGRKSLGPDDIHAAVKLLWLGWGLMVIAGLGSLALS